MHVREGSKFVDFLISRGMADALRAYLRPESPYPLPILF
jgi:hypothetical protein